MNIVVFLFDFVIIVADFLIIFIIEIFLIFLKTEFALTVIFVLHFTIFFLTDVIMLKEKKRKLK